MFDYEDIISASLIKINNRNNTVSVRAARVLFNNARAILSVSWMGQWDTLPLTG